jgi:DNA-binding CsgD family transcriptional regulator
MEALGSGGRLLREVAAELYDDLRLAPLLRRLAEHSCRVLNASASSISLVDFADGQYFKAAEHGARCGVGRTFSLSEGMTGEVATRRRPVVRARYADVSAGHLAAGHRAAEGAAAAAPIWWRGDIVGVNVVFAGDARRFTAVEVDTLEALSQMAVAGVMAAGRTDLSLLQRIRSERPEGATPGVRTMVTEVGVSRPVPASVAELAAALVALAERAAASRAATARLHVAVVHQPDGLRLLVQEEARELDDRVDIWSGAAAGWRELVELAGGGVSVEHVAGWGTAIRADLPFATVAEPVRTGDPSPFTPREAQVVRLLAEGLSDRDVAAALVISPRTVEKHVGAVLRKTDASSRTAAVVRALDRGWVDAGPARA